MLGFDYAQRHNGIIATKLISVSTTPVCHVWCNVMSNAMLNRGPQAREAHLTMQYELLVHDKLEICGSSRLTCRRATNGCYCSTCYLETFIMHAMN
ncbi:unnamed protein product [Lasius platythorax]|uniref:Uncharacterized protein n=1 Tax=Lasius platythorax TaxID=488582 RepID=A0AAV2N675_9HYME